eukprot:2899203-Pyramimonas_sp.AAC.1
MICLASQTNVYNATLSAPPSAPKRQAHAENGQTPRQLRDPNCLVPPGRSRDLLACLTLGHDHPAELVGRKTY